METSYFKLYEEYSKDFKFMVTYGSDQEIQPSPLEKEELKKWRLDSTKILVVRGSIEYSDYRIEIELSNDVTIVFKYHYDQGPGSKGDDYAILYTEGGREEYDFDDLYEEYIETEGWMSGMPIMGVLNLYEDMTGKKHGHYTGKNYGI